MYKTAFETQIPTISQMFPLQNRTDFFRRVYNTAWRTATKQNESNKSNRK